MHKHKTTLITLMLIPTLGIYFEAEDPPVSAPSC